MTDGAESTRDAAFGALRSNWYRPGWWANSALPWAVTRTRSCLEEEYATLQRRRGIDIPGAEWDTLVVVDACRWDTFRAANTLDGHLRRVRSRGSATSEWLRENFYGRTCHDTVYVTANPMHRAGEWVAPPGVDAGMDVLDGVFYDVVELWHDPHEELRTTRPETVADAALKAAEEYPSKRLLVHFMQPHYPFIGEFARGNGIGQQQFDRVRHIAETGETPAESRTVWDRLRDGEYDRATVERAYEENLAVAMPAVERVVDSLDGLTVVTTDHGNAMGERTTVSGERLWGHPPGYQTPELTEVPWLVVTPGADRRTVVAEPPATAEQGDQGAVEQRLADLGYV